VHDFEIVTRDNTHLRIIHYAFAICRAIRVVIEHYCTDTNRKRLK